MIQSDYRYKCLVYRAVDGDTFEACVITADFGFYQRMTAWVMLRLLDIDTWEKRGKNKDKGKAAQFNAWQLFQGDCRIHMAHLVTEKDKDGKYGRFLARLYLPVPKGWDKSITTNPITGKKCIQLAVALEEMGFKKEQA